VFPARSRSFQPTRLIDALPPLVSVAVSFWFSLLVGLVSSAVILTSAKLAVAATDEALRLIAGVNHIRFENTAEHRRLCIWLTQVSPCPVPPCLVCSIACIQVTVIPHNVGVLSVK
jgi:hypothetical protein